MITPLLRCISAVAVLSVCITLPVLGQADPIKFGKIDEKDLTGANFVADSAAEAVVLCDFGRSRFEPTEDGFRTVFERVTRIKILKKSGYDWATVRVPLYKKDSQTEKLVNLKGFTYNLVNGQVVKEKLATEAVFTEQHSVNNFSRKFTLPNVREGSVIEYTYVINSDFIFNFQDWQFQHSIPTRWSEYRAAIPEYFDYKMLMGGYEPLTVQEREETNTQYTVRWSRSQLADPTSNVHASGSAAVMARVTNHRWAMKDVVALRSEPFMTTARDYVSRIEFELAGIKWPDEPYKSVANTWEKINQSLLDDDNFGAQLKRGGFLKEQTTALVAKYPDVPQRIAAVHELVRKSVKYNGTDQFYSTSTLRHSYDQHSGSAADVNLLLIALLRDAGVPANPVLLSTRDHGMINEAVPLLSKFNYVVAHVALPEGKEMFVDATEALVPCGMLPPRCLSGTGRLIMPKAHESRWINLNPSQRILQYRQVQLTMDERGGYTGKIHQEHSGYAALSSREKLQKSGEKKYMEEVASSHEGWTIPKFAFKEREVLTKPLAVDYEFVVAGSDAPVSTIYMNPMRQFSEEKNPFHHETRRFPVDFGAQVDETVMMTITLPAGYQAEELPKPAVVELPDNGGRFTYTVQDTGQGTVQIASRMSLRKPMYSAEEYGFLREFYSRMLAKQAEQIVIKKKS
ncbi:DUF3857 and transglutaminase domain-containing protein [Hymenobacter sp. BT635]|uniref:DUF3857 and transglutaminase domain-containing protein n=1 Tax=Hymenobacter nitidus TaxID=2880929 RepID=A0ABS8AGX1_9BACT|nr:DUF3857 domain-containing protein [Hymenobacter nitidus]MCB2379688.1 DUF3857 and transglutaminase domain-containing protein [Hymenobacter nitidus]